MDSLFVNGMILLPLRAEKGNDKQYGDKKESNNKPGFTFGQITADPGECVGTHPAAAKPQQSVKLFLEDRHKYKIKEQKMRSKQQRIEENAGGLMFQ